MAWCGFDELMRSGVVEYAAGVDQAIRRKAVSRGVSVKEQEEQERTELQALERIITERLAGSRENEAQLLKMRAFLGLVSVARFLIQQKTDYHTESLSKPAYYSDAYSLATLIQVFDNHYESLPKELGHPTNATTSLLLTFPPMD